MHPRTRTHEWTPISLEPLNGGPDPARLVESFLTPTTRFFVRNHGTVPVLDGALWRLMVTGLVARPINLSLGELRARFPFVTRPVTIQCAGFRRAELTRVKPIPGELPWNEEPVATAEWGGVRLADLLAAAGIEAGATHVAFEGADVVEREGRTFGFGGSISMTEADAREVILATEMNGEPLTAEHGWPLRVVVPDIIGARSVKWLTRIEVRATPSDNYFQQRAYKLIDQPGAPPEVWTAAPPISTLPVNAIIGRPRAGDSLAPGPVTVTGYAWSGAPGGVAHVEVSTSGGAQWRPARLEPALPGCWRRWSIEVDLTPGRHDLVVRATGVDGGSQPADPARVWNARGYLNNAWHRLSLDVSAG